MPTYEELMAMGGKPLDEAAAASMAPKKSYSLEELMAMGGKPVADGSRPEWLTKKSPADLLTAAAQKKRHSLDELSGVIKDARYKNYLEHEQNDLIPSGEPAPPGGPDLPPQDKLTRDAGPFADDWIAQGVVGHVMGGGAGRLIAPLASKLGPLARVVQGATEGGVSNTAQGGDPTTGALIGGGFGAAGAARALVGKGAGAAREALRNPQREIGRTIQALDEAKASGITKTPEFKALPSGGEGSDQVAGAAEGGIIEHNAKKLKDAREQYGKDLDTILKENGDRHHLVIDTHDTLDRLASENSVNGEVVDENLAKAIGKTKRMLTTDTGVPVSGGGGETVTAPAVRVGDLVKVKKAVASLADYGTPATPETRPYRIIDKTIAKELEAVDPRVGEMNQRYGKVMDELESANDVAFRAQKPEFAMSAAKEARFRGLLGRAGDTTKAGTLARKDIAQLKEIDPEYARLLAPVEAKAAVERTRFGVPHVSRRMEHLPLAFAMQNADALGARVIDPMLARLSAPTTPPPTGAMQLFLNAAKEKRKRDAENAARLSGGMQQ